MRVNNKTYDVYPDLTSIVRDPSAVTKHKKEMAKFDDIENSIPIARQTILRDYYTNLVQALKKEAGTGNKISQAKLDKAIAQSVKTFAQESQNDAARIEATLAMLRAELAEQQSQRAKLVRSAHKSAGMKLGLGFLGCFGQLTGFTLGIYVFYDWNEMEPLTWIAQAFYLMVGSYYYLATRGDWVYTSVYGHMFNRAKDQIMTGAGFDEERLEAMEKYIEDLEFYLQVIYGKELFSQSEEESK
uniref:Calcium uniporter protein C-terminal domain-containing protein n=1 Tax=Favella ehrenbergii TaxID=182087 RepID=A0A7S3HZF8_9SPIT|mmetsp:Transcript_20915/g.25713  ORF Transcript_20915/g.25713 Transcript_20915/m.25713 type:complete len:243 (+) Transcript_20915:360-1088(+)|eukprot:CAMPEP_0170469632 /NCGR_PEP_ID=MMETSP0123-20130129/12397_1 /TAXON_ID=182087 /ORGANISM="Favella ehrenbergii, Strain Fehren 1" /LENGTH=242 /DNA_ID=CAMNT_0010736565 /DNA_START=361 /DNA_END=1089 /DNA_ORIENTATION=-